MKPPKTDESKKEKGRGKRRVKKVKQDDFYAFNYDIPGIEKVVLSEVTQTDIMCLVGEHVTSENPWIYVDKDSLEYNIELLEDESELAKFKDQILAFPRSKILLGYIPDELRSYDEFYICLTETAVDEIQKFQDEIQKKRKERLEGNIFKYPRNWISLGSEEDVQNLNIVDGRLRIEMEIEANYPFMAGPLVHFSERRSEDILDSSTEFLSEERDPLLMISRNRIDNFVQAAPEKKSKYAGTLPLQSRNQAMQYEYEGVMSEAITERYLVKVQNSLQTILKMADDQYYVSSFVNFYKEDYKDLVNRNEKSVTEILSCKEYTTFFDTEYCMKKFISAVAWHPMWSGTVAIAYSDIPANHWLRGQCQEDPVLSAVYSLNPVLIWSFVDGLKAKLLLLSPREVSCLSFSPFNENILVGGSVSGQVFMWDLTNKFEDVDSVEILTPDQITYRTLMNSLMTWMKNVKNLARIPATIVSNIHYTHRERVCKIRWWTPFWPLTKKGRVVPLAENQEPTAIQFMSASSDGSLMLWDISLDSGVAAAFKPKRRLRRLKKRPSTLTSKLSPFKGFDKILKPTYQLLVPLPVDELLFPITTFNIRSKNPLYELQNPEDERRRLEANYRTKYKPILTECPQFKTEALIGTGTGHILSVAWDGFDYSSSDAVPKETCKVRSLRFHDGPVVSIVRSPFIPELFLSVGGKVFAIWSDKLPNEPLYWRRSRCYYTHGVWYHSRSTMFKLTTSNGNIEVWQMTNSSSDPTEIQQISGQPISCSLTHPLTFFKPIQGVAEYNGSFRIFAYTRRLALPTELDRMKEMIDREIERKVKYKEWVAQWMAINGAIIEERKRREAYEARRKADEIAMRQMVELENKQKEEAAEAKRLAALAKPQPGKYKEWMELQWKNKELNRMHQEFFQRKTVNKELLDEQQQPLMKLQVEENKRKVKTEERQNNAQKTLYDSIALYFPEVVEVKPPPPPDPYAGGDLITQKLDLMKQYEEIEEECIHSVKVPHTFHYNWIDAMREAQTRRKNLSDFFTSPNHTNRLAKERRSQSQSNKGVQWERGSTQKSVNESGDTPRTSTRRSTAISTRSPSNEPVL